MKPEWGTKRACRKCAVHFYDLNKAEFSCPKCNSAFTAQDYIVKNVRTPDAALKKDIRKKDPDALDDPIDDLDEVLDTELEEEDLIEDTADLGDDDLDEVMKHESDSD